MIFTSIAGLYPHSKNSIMVSPCLHVTLLDYFSQTQFPLGALLATMAVQPETVTQPLGVSVTVDTSWEGPEDFVMVGQSKEQRHPQYS